MLNAYCPIDVIPISIHAPREGGDSYIFPPPCLYNKNFNPRPPRGGRLAVGRNPGQHQHISIHAPREGGDSHDRHQLLQRDDFNPRPPRGGRLSDSILVDHEEAFQSTPPARGATTAPHMLRCFWQFQSTPPARGATGGIAVKEIFRGFQSTPPARGATNGVLRYIKATVISIHAPREGGDGDDPAGRLRDIVFQSTPPARGATGRLSI